VTTTNTAAQEQAAIASADAAAADPTFQMAFPAMTEAEMISASKKAYADHVNTERKGYTQ
jgi:hypothetical protein